MEVNNLFNEILFNISDIQINEYELMKNHTTFKVGGPARYFVTVYSEFSLLQLLKACIDNEMKYMIIGNGSNLLFSDAGFNGVIIKTDGIFNAINVEENYITAGNAVLLSKLAKAALYNNLTGLEFASGIPGAVGGAILMNAGAYDGEIKNVCIKCRYIDISSLKTSGINNAIKEKTNEKICFSYRMSVFQQTGDIILDGTFKLEKVHDNTAIEEKMKDLNSRRREKQPLEYASAGSTFKRPKGFYAAKLIEDCGLKGYSCGEAQVSEKHSGFVINKGNASFSDVMNVIEHVKEVVYNRTGVILEPEVRIIE